MSVYIDFEKGYTWTWRNWESTNAIPDQNSMLAMRYASSKIGLFIISEVQGIYNMTVRK